MENLFKNYITFFSMNSLKRECYLSPNIEIRITHQLGTCTREKKNKKHYVCCMLFVAIFIFTENKIDETNTKMKQKPPN